jgi:hypothetical protein
LTLTCPAPRRGSSTNVGALHESAGTRDRALGERESALGKGGAKQSAEPARRWLLLVDASATRFARAAAPAASRRAWRSRPRPRSVRRSRRRGPRVCGPATGGGDGVDGDTWAARGAFRPRAESPANRRVRTGARTTPRPRNPRARAARRSPHPRPFAPGPPAGRAIRAGGGRRCRRFERVPYLRMGGGYRFSRRLQIFFARPWATPSSWGAIITA